MSTIVTIIKLVPILLVEFQELKLISELNQYFHFDHNIFLLDSSVDMNRFISRQEVIPQSIYVFKSVDNNITGLENLKQIQSKNTLMIVVAKGGSLETNLNLLKQIKKIQQLQFKMKIGIFLPNFASTDDVKTLFGWCKTQLIVHIFAATYAQPDGIQGQLLLNIFSFHFFGTLINVTGVESYVSFFPSLNSDFRQHQLRLTDQFSNKHFSNYCPRQFWLTVFKIMNASFVIVPIVFPSNTSKRQICLENQIDIDPTLYIVTKYSSSVHMYPMSMEAQIIIVPEAEPYSDFSAYLLTLTSNEFFVNSFIAMGAVMLILSVIRWIIQKRILFLQSVVDVLNLLMNDNSQIQYQQLSRIEVFIIVPLTFIGLVIMNGILSNMQSYLTRPVFQPQINTIEEIYHSPFSMHVLGEPWKHQLNDYLRIRTKRDDWIDKIVVLETQQYFEQMNLYDTSKSFLVNSAYLKQLLRLQKRFNLKGFHNTQTEVSKFFTAFSNIFDKFLFFERLDEIIHRIQSAGLYDLWWRRTDSIVEKPIRERHFQHLRNQDESVVKNFEFPMITVYGWLLGLIVLVIEIIWKKFKLSRMKFRRILTERFEQLWRLVAAKFSH